jgi:hypothetical protein
MEEGGPFLRALVEAKPAPSPLAIEVPLVANNVGTTLQQYYTTLT